MLYFGAAVPPQPPLTILTGRSDGIEGPNGFAFIEVDWEAPNDTDVDFYRLEIFEVNNASVQVDVIRVVDNVTQEVVVFNHDLVAQIVNYSIDVYTTNKCKQRSAESANTNVSIQLRKLGGTYLKYIPGMQGMHEDITLNTLYYSKLKP